jgi:predicted Zn-dependent protease
MKRKIFSSLVFFMITYWIISCAVNPATGKKEFMLVSEQQEIAMGKEYDPQIVQMYGVYDDDRLQEFVTAMGNQMAQVSHRPQLQYEFKVMDSPVLNAFAVPGGYVYITRGILAYLNNEAEFAGVLGHEIGHITARHSAHQMSQQQLAQVGFGVGIIAGQVAGLNETLLAGAAQVAQTGIGMLFLKFGRDDERESDVLGVEYSAKIGYDAREMANFFKTLERMHPSEGGLPSWFSTHPSSAERVANIHALAEEAQKNLDKSTLKINRNPYLRLIEGIIFDENPRQGYVENSMFYHPDLKFQFSVPAKWKLVNTPSQVQMTNEQGSAVMVFKLAPGNNPAAAAQSFLSQSNAQAVSSEGATVNGLTAHKVVSRISNKDGSVLGILSYFIAYGGNIYVFHGFSDQSKFTNFQGTFASSMTSFKSLTDPRKINVQPDRVRIKSAARRITLRDALKSHQIPDGKLEDLALLNGMHLDDQLAPNTLYKIVAK